MSGLRPPAVPAGVTALLALSLTACAASSAGGDPRSGVPSAAQAVPVVTATPALARPLPLTGLPAATGAAATRPIVAVAVDTGTGLPPATGVGDADLVYVSFPTEGRQRALALFQSRDGARVGPVAKTRPLDSKLLRPLGAVLEHGGGTAGFVRQVGDADLPEWSALVQPSSFSRGAGGALYGSTAAARGATGAGQARPGLLSFRDDAPPPGAPAPVRIRVPGQPQTLLTYDPGAGLWRGDLGGLALAATDVVVQQVPYLTLVLPKTGGRTEGNPDPNGTGAASLLTGPLVTAARWSRPNGGTSTTYVRADASAVRLVPGVTWVLLVPAGTPVLTP